MGKIFLGNTQIGVTPVGNQDISTLDEYNVSSKATARISADERAKIIPANIKKDVEILGVTGTHQGGKNVNDTLDIENVNMILEV